MTQAERDLLEKAKKKLITQKEAADELGVTERHVRRLLRQLKRRGDKVVAHALRGLPFNHKISADTEQEAAPRMVRKRERHEPAMVAA
jgi:biotin operon repressor